MKTIACLVLICAISTHGLLAQKDAGFVTLPVPHRVRVSAELADKMLIHKADLVCPKVAMPARFIGTVVVTILIDTHGNVVRSTLISGPPMLRNAVLDAVRNYKYKPYLLNDTAVEVVSTVSVAVDSYRDCHIE
jgi:protein TonB